jgi:hypothetical protein
MTIDQLIEALTKARTLHPLAGGVVVHLCEEEREYAPIVDAGLDIDPDGACFLVALHKLSPRTSLT